MRIMTRKLFDSDSNLVQLTSMMLIEEWRVQSSLFDGRRFGLFPFALFFLSFIASASLVYIGISQVVLQILVFSLALLLGLQSGLLGFEGADAIRNLLGEVTLLVYSSKTLPISEGTAMKSFILKDSIYYSVLFIIPLSIGVLLGFHSMDIVLQEPMRCMALICKPPTLIERFSSMLAITGGALVIYLVGLLASVGFTRAFSGFLSRKKKQNGSITEKATQSLILPITDRFSIGGRGSTTLAVKTIYEVLRSSGGYLKLLFSSAILLAVATLSVVVVQGTMIDLMLSPGVTFGALLSVTAFPTYSWLTQIDSPEEYRFYPVSLSSLFNGKALSFLILETPIVLIYYLWVAFTMDPSLLDALFGGLTFFGLIIYVFGLTVYLTGFEPGSYMFDTKVYLTYSALVIGALLPILIVGLFVPLGASASVGLGVYVLLLGGGGYKLFQLAKPKWRNQMNAF